MIGYKGYDADYMVKAAKAEAVIVFRAKRRIAREYDAELYKERNLIEPKFK